MSAAPRLRLALVRQRYVADGGAERFVARALQALGEENVSLSLVARRWQSAAAVDVISCNPFYLGNVWRDWSFARCACAKIRTAAVDLVQSHERIACCDIYRAGDGVHREWLHQRRRSLSRWGRFALALNPYHYYVKAAEAKLFASPRLRAVICNSYMVKREIERYFAVPGDKLHVIYSGVDTALFHPDLRRHRAMVRARLEIADDTPLFLFVGSGFERKGLAAALAALVRVPQAHLAVVGGDKREPRYRERARQYGIADRVHFLGRQSDVAPYYGAADAAILPTLYDPFPNVALEAMASGLPLITSRQCGAAELIQSGVNGYVCDALDIDGLESAVRELAVDTKRVRMAQAARVAVAPLDLVAMSSRLLSLYRELLASETSRSRATN